MAKANKVRNTKRLEHEKVTDLGKVNGVNFLKHEAVNPTYPLNNGDYISANVGGEFFRLFKRCRVVQGQGTGSAYYEIRGSQADVVGTASTLSGAAYLLREAAVAMIKLIDEENRYATEQEHREGSNITDPADLEEE